MIILRAITTKWLGPTDRSGSRVKATAHSGPGGSLTHHWDYGIANDMRGVSDVEGNHIAAARKLAEKLGWSGMWCAGASPDERGYVFVRASVENEFMRAAGAYAFTVPAWEA